MQRKRENEREGEEEMRSKEEKGRMGKERAMDHFLVQDSLRTEK